MARLHTLRSQPSRLRRQYHRLRQCRPWRRVRDTHDRHPWNPRGGASAGGGERRAGNDPVASPHRTTGGAGDGRAILHRVARQVGWHTLILPASQVLTVVGMGTDVHQKKPIQGPAVIVSNHVHPFDELALVRAMWPRVTYFVSMDANFDIPVAGKILSFFGTIPVGSNAAGLREFHRQARRHLAAGDLVGIFPEGERGHDPRRMAPLRPGAFELAVGAGVPVIPCRLVGTGHVFGLLWRRERLDVWVGDPIVPDPAMTRHHAARAMMAQASAQFEELSRRHWRP